jgi:hypothetical protein
MLFPGLGTSPSLPPFGDRSRREGEDSKTVTLLATFKTNEIRSSCVYRATLSAKSARSGDALQGVRTL